MSHFRCKLLAISIALLLVLLTPAAADLLPAGAQDAVGVAALGLAGGGAIEGPVGVLRGVQTQRLVQALGLGAHLVVQQALRSISAAR